MRLSRLDQQLHSMRKPLPQVISDIEPLENDQFVICAGFEDRTVEILKRLGGTNRALNILVIEYLPTNTENKLNLILEHCGRRRCNLTRIVYDREHPQGFGDKLVSELSNDGGRIFIDVSGMSRLLIIQLITAFATSSIGLRNLNILYFEALNYPPSKERAMEVILEHEQNPNKSILLISSGVLDVCVLPELSSVAMQGEPVRLVVFPSFNADQLNVLRSATQPSFLTLIHGRPPQPNLSWRLELIKRLNRIEADAACEESETSTLDYVETLDELLSIYDKHGDINRIIVAPTGSKMQAVAVGIFRAFMSDIQIVYPAASQFAKPMEYTNGVGPFHCLALGDFHDFQKNFA